MPGTCTASYTRRSNHVEQGRSQGKAEEIKGKAKQAAGDLTMMRTAGRRRSSGSRRQGSRRIGTSSTESRRGHQGRRRRGQALEQRHLDRGSRLDRLHVGGNLDITIRARHAGDVAGRLERGDGDAVLDSHCIKLMAADGRDDALRERQREGLRICGARRAIRRSTGTSSMCAFERHDVGYPGIANTGFPSTTPRPVGLPGFTATP